MQSSHLLILIGLDNDLSISSTGHLCYVVGETTARNKDLNKFLWDSLASILIPIQEWDWLPKSDIIG